MAHETFRSWVARRSSAGEFAGQVEATPVAEPAPGEVLIDVEWSSLNYKDALAATGQAGVVKQYPHVPGIDAAGVVRESNSTLYQPGDAVLVTGYDLGVARAGGWAERVCVPAAWIVPLPSGFTAREAMLYGTAGFTAGLSLLALQAHGITPARGPVLVTGASGGVGSVAVRLLAQQHYEVVAITGKQALRATLLGWGAKEVLGRAALGEATSKPLLPARWAGVIDCVGGTMLASAIKQTQPSGCVAACGLTGGVELPLTVFPFILRGVTLAGIDSVWCDAARRQQVWHHFANEWRLPNLDTQVTTVNLDEMGAYVPKILQGEVAGRVIVSPRG